MTDVNLWVLLSMAFGLGMLHALDADHIMAVSSLSCRESNWKTVIRYSLRWAIGHGSALMLIGVAVFFLGMAIPESMSQYAENCVGLVLVGIGVWVIRDLRKKNAHLHFHSHDDLPQHAHWHVHSSKTHHPEEHRHEHTPVMIGLLHGTAGSAPLLAILPVSTMSSPWMGFSYLLLFSLGVVCAMLLFGGVLAKFFGVMQKRGNQVIRTVRLVIAMASIVFGVVLLRSVVF